MCNSLKFEFRQLAAADRQRDSGEAADCTVCAGEQPARRDKPGLAASSRPCQVLGVPRCSCQHGHLPQHHPAASTRQRAVPHREATGGYSSHQSAAAAAGLHPSLIQLYDGCTPVALFECNLLSQVDLWLACSGLSSAASAYAELYAAAHGAAWELVGRTEMATHQQGRRHLLCASFPMLLQRLRQVPAAKAWPTKTCLVRSCASDGPCCSIPLRVCVRAAQAPACGPA